MRKGDPSARPACWNGLTLERLPMDAFVGIDVGKDTLVVVLLRGSEPLRATVDNTPEGHRRLRNWLAKHHRKQTVGQVHACLEATGTYGDEGAVRLHQAGYAVSVVNPARIKAFGESRLSRNKTDAADAWLIAEFCRTQTPPAWSPPAAEVLTLRRLARHLDDLQTMRQQEVNRLAAGPLDEAIRQRLESHIAFLDAQIAAVWQDIHDHIDHHPDLKRQRDLLDTIPGIGDISACLLLAELPDLSRFDRAEQLAAYAGVTPKQHTSGTSIRGHTRMARQGNPTLRTRLYFPALSAKTHNPLIRPLAQRLKSEGHCALSIIVAALRKLLHQIFGILTSGQPFDPDVLTKKLTTA
jgi:transposase